MSTAPKKVEDKAVEEGVKAVEATQTGKEAVEDKTAEAKKAAEDATKPKSKKAAIEGC